MKKRMEQLINGKFEYAVPKLILSEQEIVVAAAQGKNVQGEFFFGAEDNSKVKGMVFSTDRRIVLAQDQFSGNTVHIQYGIDTGGLKGGDSLTGQIVICSSLGEYRVTIILNVQGQQVKSSRGEIQSLKQFTALAQADYHEAFRLFTKDTFGGILTGRDKKYEALYKGMSQNPITYQHMEEFLIGAGQKEPVIFSIDKSEKELLNLEGSTKDSLYIYKDVWGYSRMEVEVVGDFLQVEKKVITTDDFIGSVYGLEYVVLREKLGKGRKRGRIIIRSVYKTLVFEIVASAYRDYELSTRRFERNNAKALAREYLDLLVQKDDYRTWKERTLKLLEELKGAGCYNVMHQLIEAYVYFAEDNAAKTLELLWMLKERSFAAEEAQEEGLYLYLAREVELLPQESRDISERIQMLYRKNQESILLLWLLLHVDEEFVNAPVKQLYMLERQFEMGCTSPFLYQMAAQILQKDENHLKKLSPFMTQVLFFAARYGMLNQELAMRISYLAIHEKKFKSSIYRILIACYDVYPGKDMLEAICKMIMLGQPRKPEYFKWYALAVEQDVRLTRLYEFYIETMGKHNQEPLPQPVKLYFAYNNTLSNSKKASVYANVISNKEIDEKTYQSYRETMQAFTLESLQERRMNQDYAVLYQEFLEKLDNQAMGEAAAEIIFSHRLYCDDPKIRNVIVCHSAFAGEDVYPFNDKVAYVNIYTPDAQIMFEDAKHRRYVATVDYNLQKLIDHQDIVKQCVALDVCHAGLLLHVCGSNAAEARITIGSLGCFQHVIESASFTELYKQGARRRLLQYYDKNAGEDTINEYIKGMDYQAFYQVDNKLLMEVLIRRGFSTEAFALISEYGHENIDGADLLKLCRRLILDMDFVEHEELIWLAYDCLRLDKYDDVVLGYLRDTYIGPVDSMIMLWEKLKGFEMDTYELEEEILLLTMYTRVYRPDLSHVLESYIRSRGKEGVIVAMLCFLSYGYFLADIRIDAFIFHSLESVFDRNWDMDIICWLALLKRYRFCRSLSAKQKKNIVRIMQECQRRELRFALFAELPKSCTKSFQVQDKIFVEEIVHPKATVTLHYALTRGAEVPVFLSEPMRQQYHGIVTREFLLFYGEQLTWYLTVQEGDHVQQTQIRTITMDSVSSEGKTKYQMINQMLANHRLGKEEALDEAMQRYLYLEQKVEQLFTQMGEAAL